MDLELNSEGGSGGPTSVCRDQLFDACGAEPVLDLHHRGVVGRGQPRTSSIVQLSECLRATQKVRVEVPKLYPLFPWSRDRRVMTSRPGREGARAIRWVGASEPRTRARGDCARPSADPDDVHELQDQLDSRVAHRASRITYGWTSGMLSRINRVRQDQTGATGSTGSAGARPGTTAPVEPVEPIAPVLPGTGSQPAGTTRGGCGAPLLNATQRARGTCGPCELTRTA